MTTLSLGISPCPNDVFIFSGILLNQIPMNNLRFDVDFQDVENLNQQAQAGRLDVVKISYANYIHCRNEYDLLPCGGALGRGVGPLLLVNAEEKEKRRKGEKETEEQGTGNREQGTEENALSTINYQLSTPASSFILHPSSFPLLVPGVNTTANFLLDFYANPNGTTPLQKRFLPFDALYDELCRTPGARGVVIHEKRFTYEQDGLTLIQDLGAYWEQQTGYAIPLGAICVRKSLDLAAQLTDIIQRSLAWAYAHYEQAFELCKQYAQDLSAGVVESHIRLYVNSYSENLGADGEAAVRFFLEQQGVRQ